MWSAKPLHIMNYVLEVVRVITEGFVSKCIHVGYMRATFRTKEDAASYYDRHNTHMLGLNVHNTWRSQVDPVTHLMYIVREDYGVEDIIAPFDPLDAAPPCDINGWATYYFKK